MTKTRIDQRFALLRNEGRAGLVTFITAGDPDQAASLELLRGLPKAGADIIELGMPFSDPMADGPVIQAASLRALSAGGSMAKTLALVQAFREHDATTPIVLMGYYNPIFRFGVPPFLDNAKRAGVDGLIVVDLPPEEDRELCLPTLQAGLNFIRLATPTTDEKRLAAVLANASGFLYYVSVAGITGTKSGETDAVSSAVQRLRRRTDLPIAVGFGIREPRQAAAVAQIADAAVVGSAIVEAVAARGPRSALDLVKQLSGAVRSARA